MFPSGIWKGFWQQEGWGQQPMSEFELYFSEGIVRGSGVDLAGRFIFSGEYDEKSGQVEMKKQYVGRHIVEYCGGPNGEGAIVGTWRIRETVGNRHYDLSGPFLIQPDLPLPGEDAPVFEIRPRGRDTTSG